MMHHRRANKIRSCSIRQARPGIIQPFMQPAKLRNQVKTGSPETKLKFRPVGKTLVGGTQWAIKIARPGLAAPLIVAKKEQQAMAKIAIAAKKVKAKGAVAAAKAKAKAKAKGKAKALNGWFF